MKTQRISVELEGISDILFDRFYDHSTEDRPPEKKLYLAEDDAVVLPADNIYSFFFRDMAPTGVIRFVEKRGAADYIKIGQANLSIPATLLPFTDGKKPIKFAGFDGKRFMVNDWSAGVTKMSGGKIIKQEIRKRPIMKMPWFLPFEMILIENDKVTAEKLQTWLEIGGFVIALGSYRPRYGKFSIKRFELN